MGKSESDAHSKTPARKSLLQMKRELLAIIFGSITTIGGLIGFLKSNSVASLIAGATFGALYLSSALLISENQKYGNELATITSVVLLAAMAKKATSLKPVPVILSIIGGVGAYYYGSLWKRQ